MKKTRIARLVAAGVLAGAVLLPASDALAAPSPSVAKQSQVVKKSSPAKPPTTNPGITPLSLGPWP